MKVGSSAFGNCCGVVSADAGFDCVAVVTVDAAFATTTDAVAVGTGDDKVFRGDGLGGATIGRLCDDGCILPLGRCRGATLVPDSTVGN